MISIIANFFSSMSTTLFTVTSILIVTYFIKVFNRHRRLPPGPWGLPIVGYFPFLSSHMYLDFMDLAKRFGPVFSLRFGQTDVVIVNKWEFIKETLTRDELLGRPGMTFFPTVPEKSIVEMSGETWRQQRRVALQILRDVGFGKSAMEEAIKDEIDQFLGFIESKKGQPIDFIYSLGPSVSNNIAILLFGHKFSYNDPVKIRLEDAFNYFNENFKFAGLTTFFPFMSKILIALGHSTLKEMANSFECIDNYIGKEIESHKNQNRTSTITDYIDGYLQEIESREAKKTNDSNEFKLSTLRRNATSFFGAGTETVKSTLTWIMFYLIAYPEYQEKIRTEIASVIGFNRFPSYEDRNRMPLTMAFLNEVQRIASVVPTNLLRRAMSDVTIGPYTLPKDITVIVNFWSVHHDPDLWPEPEKFKPQRFLSDDGTKFIKSPYLIPFSYGKRNCPGEGLANVELFLYTVCLVQRFHVKPESSEPLSFETVYAIARRPAKFPNLIFEKID